MHIYIYVDKHRDSISKFCSLILTWKCDFTCYCDELESIDSSHKLYNSATETYPAVDHKEYNTIFSVARSSCSMYKI